MNKLLKQLLCIGMCGAMAGSILLSAGCNNDQENNPGGGDKPTEKVNDTETRPLMLSTGALDGNFNPFFYTALNDGAMLSNTQIAMLTVDEDGNLVCGQKQPTAVLDYKYTMYDEQKVGEGNVTSTGSADGRTEYEFVLKNGIKFSDGVDLTMADVLFNLYVYLDKAYTGSNTIYSTEIQGLKAYREDKWEIDDGSNADTESTIRARAIARIIRLVEWSMGDLDESEVTKDDKDLLKVKDLFNKYLDSYWASLYTSWSDSYKNMYNFNSAWQAMVYEFGLVQEQQRYVGTKIESIFNDLNGDGVRQGADGEYIYTTLDPTQKGAIGINMPEGETFLYAYIEDMQAAMSAEEIAKYIADNPDATEEYAEEQLEKQGCFKIVLNEYIENKENLSTVISIIYNDIYDDFLNEERFNEYQNRDSHVNYVSGITTYELLGSELNASFKGEMSETYVDSESYEVLKIVINGIDPKAIYNFSFTISPLHYYSTNDYNGKKCIDEARENYNAENPEDLYFGVEKNDPDFFKTVLQDSDKVGLPVGAGPYMAADSNGNSTLNKNKFKENNIVYFVRNPYFNTLGTGMENAKIKFVQFKVLNDDQILQALTTKSIDYGMPNANASITDTLAANDSFLSYESYDTGGYGYVGVNPKFVPEYQIRRAIMKSMNVDLAAQHFTEQYASVIYRPVSKTSWAYPVNTDGSYVGPYDAVKYAAATTEGNDEIRALVTAAGYTLQNGKYVKTRIISGQGNAAMNSQLKFTFTIAGDATDHPAVDMFNLAAQRLNGLGFDITVANDSQALQKMAIGNLAVWAAAWSSSIDPDPYQIYHKDSKASSVLNWNYNNIINDHSATNWTFEWDLIEEISDLIDEGRATLAQNIRTGIYARCYDKIMELSVELPTYQRSDICVYNKTVIDGKSLVQKPSYNLGLFDKIWEIDYV